MEGREAMSRNLCCPQGQQGGEGGEGMGVGGEGVGVAPVSGL